MDDIPPRSYGPLIETTLRVVTWNVWGLYGPWRAREAAIVATLQDADPDIVVLTESWSKDGDSQCDRLAGPLGLPHHAFSGIPAEEDDAALSGVAVLSRWPIRRESSLTFGGARVQFAELAGPRGPVQVYGLVMDAWWFDQSQPRQQAVRDLLTSVRQAQDTRAPLVVCGDFNADPDSDEIRMLTGRPAPRLCRPSETRRCWHSPRRRHVPLGPLRRLGRPPLLSASLRARLSWRVRERRAREERSA
jgi:endonuclease/exonuclease/phosphatase family metal-dependent hydrolase